MSNKQDRVYLSPNWVETKDKSTGRTYYANIQTKETLWQIPTEKIQQDIAENGPANVAQRSPAAAAVKSKQDKEDVWLERQDPKSGKVYYFNPKLKKTAWHRPDQVISTDVHATGDGKGQWVERIDPRTGRPYYYNPILGVTSWTNPDAEEDEAKNKRTSAALSGNFDKLKRLSANIGNRLSFGALKAASSTSGNADSNRNSARFSLSTPAVPINKSTPRTSIRLDAGDDFEDKFAALRAMVQQKPQTMIGESTTEPNSEEYLLIKLHKLMDQLELTMPLLDIDNYAATKYNTRRTGMFTSGRNVSIDTLKYFQRTPMKKSLHSFSEKALTADAMLAFKIILWYCGDKSLKKNKPGDVLAQEFVSFGVQTDAMFQAELYCQLMKQATRNPMQSSVELVYELFAVACGCFKPPPDLLPYVLSHLRSTVEMPPTDRIKSLALYSILRLEKAIDRVEPPSVQEVAAVRSISPVELRVELISAQPLTIQAECWTTIGDLKLAIEKRYQIKDGAPFAIFEISNQEQERVLEDSDSVMDLLHYWERSGGSFRMIYKIRLYFDINEEDTAAIELAYLQAVFEVNDQRYPCEEEDAIRLAALEAQEKFGDFNGTDVFGDQLGAYLPPKYYNPESAEQMKADIYNEYQKMTGTDKLQAMINYLSYVKKWPYYGSSYYFAEPVQLKVLGKEFPKTVIIGINAKGALIIDPGTLDQIVEYPYSEIVTWGHSPANFVLVVGNLVRSTKLFFSTVDGKEMNQLIHAYVHKLMEAQTEEDKAQMILNQFRDD